MDFWHLGSCEQIILTLYVLQKLRNRGFRNRIDFSSISGSIRGACSTCLLFIFRSFFRHRCLHRFVFRFCMDFGFPWAPGLPVLSPGRYQNHENGSGRCQAHLGIQDAFRTILRCHVHESWTLIASIFHRFQLQHNSELHLLRKQKHLTNMRFLIRFW